MSTRIAVALAMTLTMGVAHADNSNLSHNNGYAGAGPAVALMGMGAVMSFFQGQLPVPAQSGVGYSTQSAVITMPMSGVRCELTSFMDNGVLRTVNLCR
jgi:hypothetical protein